MPVALQPNAVDPIVPARFSHGYAGLAAAARAGTRVRVLPPVGEGHCRFPAETVPVALDTVRGP